MIKDLYAKVVYVLSVPKMADFIEPVFIFRRDWQFIILKHPILMIYMYYTICLPVMHP
jgi:hypothetical protein